jgi:nicotinate-nucleotide adenylyltransferase
MDKYELKIGIFGGTFDPPHIAHLRIAEEVKEIFNLNYIWFIPAGNPPHKKTFAEFSDRLKMLELAVKNNPDFKVLDIEKDIRPSYTVRTLQILKKLYPEFRFFFIMGWDSFKEIETWWNASQILNYAELIVVSRGEITPEEAQIFIKKAYKKLWKDFPENYIHFYSMPRLEISATFVRNLIKKGRSVRYLVPEEVYFYIKKEKLYC